MSPLGRTQFELFKTHKCKLIPFWTSKRFDYMLIIYWKNYKKLAVKKQNLTVTTWQFIHACTVNSCLNRCHRNFFILIALSMCARTLIYASIVVIETSTFWLAYWLWDCNCTKLQISARNYTFFTELQSNGTALNQSESSNFLLYMISGVICCNFLKIWLMSSLEWFASAHKRVLVDFWFDVKSRTNFLQFLGASKLHVFQNILRYIFYNAPGRHICKLFFKAFPSKQGKNKVQVLDLTSNRDSTYAMLKENWTLKLTFHRLNI